MGAFTVGHVVMVNFPFSDLSGSKRRPAVILAVLEQDDYILCQITSKPYDTQSIILNQTDFFSGSLQRVSYARTSKIFTAHQSIISSTVGQLNQTVIAQLLQKVITIFSNH